MNPNDRVFQMMQQEAGSATTRKRECDTLSTPSLNHRQRPMDFGERKHHKNPIKQIQLFQLSPIFVITACRPVQLLFFLYLVLFSSLPCSLLFSSVPPPR